MKIELTSDPQQACESSVGLVPPLPSQVGMGEAPSWTPWAAGPGCALGASGHMDMGGSECGRAGDPGVESMG